MILYLSFLGNVPMENHMLSLGMDGISGSLKEIKRGLRFVRIGTWQEKPPKLRERRIEANAAPGCNSTYDSHEDLVMA